MILICAVDFYLIESIEVLEVFYKLLCNICIHDCKIYDICNSKSFQPSGVLRTDRKSSMQSIEDDAYSVLDSLVELMNIL